MYRGWDILTNYSLIVISWDSHRTGLREGGDDGTGCGHQHFWADAEKHLHDLLDQIEHVLKPPDGIILFFFGLLNAGVGSGSIGYAAWLVIGFVAPIGFAVLLFVASAAFDPVPAPHAVKMALLCSFAASDIAILAGKLLQVEKKTA